jgi:prevent-host-death family protein
MSTITDMTEYRTITDAKAHLNELVDFIEATDEQVVITRNGLPVARLLSMEDYESLIATIDVLSIPGILEDLREAEEAERRGDVVSADVIREEFLRDG